MPKPSILDIISSTADCVAEIDTMGYDTRHILKKIHTYDLLKTISRGYISPQTHRKKSIFSSMNVIDLTREQCLLKWTRSNHKLYPFVAHDRKKTHTKYNIQPIQENKKKRERDIDKPPSNIISKDNSTKKPKPGTSSYTIDSFFKKT